MDSEFLLNPLFLQIKNKFLIKVFSSTIGMEDLDLGIKLRLTPGFIFLIGLEGVTLGTE